MSNTTETWGTWSGRTMVSRQIRLAHGFTFMFFNEVELTDNAEAAKRQVKHNEPETFISDYKTAYRTAVAEYHAKCALLAIEIEAAKNAPASEGASNEEIAAKMREMSLIK